MTSAASISQLPATALSALQREFAIYKGTGSFGVVDLQSLKPQPGTSQAPRLVVFPKSEATTLLRRRLETLPYPCTSPKSVIEAFWIDPHTLVYDRVTFDPQNVNPSTLNLWVGPTITPVQGDWPTIREFLLDTICNGDQTLFEYLLNLEAHAYQRPAEKPGVMVIFLGGQGIGKGTMQVLLRRIWGATTLLVNKVDLIVGQFNGVMERAYNIFLDEAVFHGDRRATEALKSIVTSEHITINEKNQPARQIPSVHRFYAASNATHFAATESDDRRAIYIRISDRRKGDASYWDAVYKAIQGQEAAHFAHSLSIRDISKFRPRDRPASAELTHQKLLSLTGIHKFWYEFLRNEIGSMNTSFQYDSLEWRDGGFVSTRTLLDSLELFNKGVRTYQKSASHELAEALRRLCPSMTRKRQQNKFNREHGYVLPALETARKEFEQFISGSVDWPEA